MPKECEVVCFENIGIDCVFIAAKIGKGGILWCWDFY